MEFDLKNPLSDFYGHHSDSLAFLFHVESGHMPSEDYFTNLQFSCNFDPLLSYLAVNYLDRFMSCHEMLQWVIKLLAISCVSLAAKMNKYYGGISFDAQTISRMEAIILGAFKWRMHSITPFSFISFSLSFFLSSNVTLLPEYAPLQLGSLTQIHQWLRSQT
ncbi:hypothetical protein UlMin_043619 [Ulmus minor]